MAATKNDEKYIVKQKMHQMIGKTNILTIQSKKSLKNVSTVSSTDLKISVDIYALPHHSTENRPGKAK